MKNLIRLSIVSLLFIPCVMAGCGSNPPSEPVASTPDSSSMEEEGATDHAAIEEAFSKLSPEDRVLAESQKFCAIATTSPLGSMGTPLKIDVNGEAVFLCCAGCKNKALRNPEETLASVAKLKAENSVSKDSPK